MLALVFLMFAHSWYPRECCSDQDCRPVPCSEISYKDGAYFYDGVRFNEIKVRPSPDEQCHACYGLMQTVGACLFLPQHNV
jgi:hypothetical protein